MITYNYRIYKIDKEKRPAVVMQTGSDKKAKSLRGMKQAITRRIGEEKVADSEWEEASDDEYLRCNKNFVLYAHVTDFNEPPPILPRYSNGEYDVWQ